MSVYGKIARSAVEHYVRTQEVLPLSPGLPGELLRQQACYVSIFENPGRHLRGLFGSPLPQQPVLAQEIIMNTINALTQNEARVVARADVQYMAYTVAVLDPLQRISDPEHLDPFSFGIYVRSDRGKAGVLLPQRAGIETPEDQIATVLREAKIDTRLEEYVLYRFQVTFFDD